MSPRAIGSASPARLHFRRQYRHPGAPALEIEVYEKGEEMIEWQKKTDRKQAANQRVATNQRKPLKLTVGLRVLVEDKQGNNTLPGEIVGVRSQRSCWVRMEGSDRIFLRNRRFLVKDPSFNTQQLNMVRRHVEHEGGGFHCCGAFHEPSSEAGFEEQRGGHPAWWRQVCHFR